MLLEIVYTLSAANGSPIGSYGIAELCLDFHLPKPYRWNFVVADVQYPILGADFLKANHLLPDLTRGCLVDGKTFASAKGTVQSHSHSSIHLITSDSQLDERVRKLLQRFPTLAQPPQYFENPKHPVLHHIETNGPPVYDKSRRLRPDIEKKVKQQFTEMSDVGICRVSKSPWASPIVVVSKESSKDIRVVGDYRKLNAVTVPDRYPIRNLYDVFNDLNGCKIFSYLDLIRAYHNIPVFTDDIPKTAVISPVGLYEYCRMPLGLKNAPSTFQRFINSILGDLPFLYVYIDDILIFSNDPIQHERHLEIIFERLHNNGLTVNFRKSRFFAESVEFLGHKISPQGFEPLPSRIELFRTMTKPRTITALRSLLGILNFYRRFAKSAALYLAPLNDLLIGHPKKKDRTPIQWTPQLDEAFEKVRSAFTQFTLLHFPNNDCTLLLTTDASDIAHGAVLEQVTNAGERQPLGFFSGKFSAAQQKWSPYDKELYAIYAAVDHFSYMLEARHFTILTDHRPLLEMFKTKKRIKLEKRSRYIEYISQFSTDIKHISGVSNIIADALSRPQIDAISHPAVTLDMIATLQVQDEEILQIGKNGYQEHQIRNIFIEDSNKSILCSFFNNVNRPLIPKILRYRLFEQVHGVAHFGTNSTLRLLRSKYYWPKMTADIRLWCKSCGKCQKNKVTRHTKSPLGTFPDSDRFEHVHMDLVVMKNIDGYRYICTFMDRSTRWVEAIPLKETTAETIARTFYEHWVSRYGVPLRLTTDRGPQFRSELFHELCKLLGTELIQTTAYNPKANGALERWHRVLKSGLKCRGKNWIKELPTVLLGLRAVPRDDTGISCGEMTFGRTLKLPGEFWIPSSKMVDKTVFVQNLRDSFSRIRPAPFLHKTRSNIFVHPDLKTCKKVYVRVDKVRLPAEAPYDGPFEVIKKASKYFTIRLKNGKEDTVSIDRLKPAYELNDSVAGTADAEPPPSKRSNLKTIHDFNLREPVISSPSIENEVNVKLNTIRNKRPSFYSQITTYPVFPFTANPSLSSQGTRTTQKSRTTSRGRTIRLPARYR